LDKTGTGIGFPDELKEILNVENDANAIIYCQYPLQRYVCDFVDINNKIVYLVNGDFWHANPILYDKDKLTKVQKHNRRHDKNRRIYLETKGFVVYEIWESEVLWNKDVVKEKIRASRKRVTPAVLHAVLAEFESQDAHKDWSEQLRSIWFKKPKEKKITRLLCKQCGKEFSVSFANKKLLRRQYCGKKCFNIDNRVVERPSKEQLEKDIKNMSICATGHKYNVSDNTVRKWIKHYDRGKL